MKRKLWSSIALDRALPQSLQVQLSDGLKGQIQATVLAAGTLLPSTRDLAKELGVSRNTVIAAYDRLLGEGYLESRPRSSIVVCAGVNGKWDPPSVSEQSKTLPGETRPEERFAVNSPPAFRPCQPDVRLFPMPLWNRMRNRALKKWGAHLLHYQSAFALGWPGLRQALANYLAASRGVHCRWQNIAITSGSQQALFLLSQLLLNSKSRVAMEDPGYPGARLAFRHAGARIQSMPSEALGTSFPSPTRRVDLIYTTPSRQFPTGATLSVARRLRLLEGANRAQSWLLEDDYDSEFRYARPPLPSLHGLDRSGRVIYLGSMSKVLLPTLRIGYVVLPDTLVDPFESLRLLVDDHGPMIDQAALAEFIEQGGFYSHIRRSRKAYAARLQVFLQTAQQLRLPLHFEHTDGGMNQTGMFRDKSVDDQSVSAALSAAGLDIRALSLYRHRQQGGQPGLVFGFTAFEPAVIRAALKSTAHVFRTLGIL